MDFLKLFLQSSVIANLVWVVLIIIIVLLFRKPIIDQISGLSELRWRDWVAKFAERAARSAQEKETEKVSEKVSAYSLATNLGLIQSLIVTGGKTD